MRKMFDEMPEELKAMFGITGEESTPTEFSGADFDYDNPPTSSEEIPDSVIPVEAMKKLVQARKLIIEARDLMIGEGDERFPVVLATRSPYAQAQWLFFNDTLNDTIVKINTLLHIHDEGDNSIKKAIDEQAQEEGMSVKDYVRRLLITTTMSKIFGM